MKDGESCFGSQMCCELYGSNSLHRLHTTLLCSIYLSSHSTKDCGVHLEAISQLGGEGTKFGPTLSINLLFVRLIGLLVRENGGTERPSL